MILFSFSYISFTSMNTIPKRSYLFILLKIIYLSFFFFFFFLSHFKSLCLIFCSHFLISSISFLISFVLISFGKSFSKVFPKQQWVNLACSIILVWSEGKISSPLRYSSLSIFPDDNADIFAASLLISNCSFSSLIFPSIYMIC